jgi:hypothetical protein
MASRSVAILVRLRYHVLVTKRSRVEQAAIAPDGSHVELASPLTAGWKVYAYFVLRPEGYVIGELRVLPEEQPLGELSQAPLGYWSRLAESVPVGGLTGALLRDVSVTDLSGRVNAVLRDGAKHYQDAPWAPPMFRRPPRTAKRPGRAGHPRSFYAVWAQDYVRCLSEPAPIVALAKRRRVSQERARSVVHECRSKGYLTEGRRGKAGGALTPLAVDVLNDVTREEGSQ